MNTSELPFLSAGDLSRLIQSKEVSPVEATTPTSTACRGQMCPSSASR